jgi:hypothetical protein
MMLPDTLFMTNLQNGAIYQGYCRINQMLKADLCRESDRSEINDDYRLYNNDYYHYHRQQKYWWKPVSR